MDSTECAWQPTGLKVNQGDTLVFRASGQVVCWMSADKRQKQYATPDGTPGTTSANCWLAPGLKNNALVGKIGNGSPFFIGSSKTITAGSSGTLYLAMNESSKCGGCLDNDGSWTVEIRQTAKCGPDGTTGTTSANCWLAPGLKNNALVGKIGNGSPFLIGSSKTITAGTSGTLYLGMNESSKCGGCADNDGSWWVDVRIDTPCSDDGVEPSVSISCGTPACQAGSGKISISWSGSDNCTPSSQLTFRWRLDSGAWSGWSSSKSVSYTGLAQGAHAFLIQARDQAGNVADDACDFFVDCGDDDPPDLEINCGGISQTCQAGGATVKITWSASDSVTPGGSIQYRWKLENGGTWTAWKTNVTTTTYQPVPDGFHTFYVQAKDEAGNISDDVCDFDVDCGPGEDDEPPDLAIQCDDISQTCQANGAAAKITWSASDNETTKASIQYRWKLGKSGTWSGWKANTTAVTYQGLANGAYTIYVEAQDGVGNISGDVCDFDVDCELEEDADPPDITLHCGDPTCEVNGGSVTISWSATDDVTPSGSIEFRYRLGKESWTSWRSYVTTKTYSGLADGLYSFTLQARDAAKNVSEEQCEFEVENCMTPEGEDKEAPAVEIKVGPVTCSAEGGEVSISWTITDDVSATGRIDRMFWLEDEDGDVVYESKWTRTETSKTFTKLGAGEYAICVSAEDEAGNLAELEQRFPVPCCADGLSDQNQDTNGVSYWSGDVSSSLLVQPAELAFGIFGAAKTMQLRLCNVADHDLEFAIGCENDGVKATPSTGRIAIGACVSVDVTVDRRALSPGSDSSASLSIQGEARMKLIPISIGVDERLLTDLKDGYTSDSERRLTELLDKLAGVLGLERKPMDGRQFGVAGTGYCPGTPIMNQNEYEDAVEILIRCNWSLYQATCLLRTVDPGAVTLGEDYATALADYYRSIDTGSMAPAFPIMPAAHTDVEERIAELDSAVGERITMEILEYLYSNRGEYSGFCAATVLTRYAAHVRSTGSGLRYSDVSGLAIGAGLDAGKWSGGWEGGMPYRPDAQADCTTATLDMLALLDASLRRAGTE